MGTNRRREIAWLEKKDFITHNIEGSMSFFPSPMGVMLYAVLFHHWKTLNLSNLNLFESFESFECFIMDSKQTCLMFVPEEETIILNSRQTSPWFQRHYL